MRLHTFQHRHRGRTTTLGASSGAALYGATIAIVLALPPGASLAETHHSFRHKLPARVAQPTPARLVMPSEDYAGAFSDPRGAYTAKPVWLKADPRPGAIDYEMQSGTVGSLGLKPASDTHFTASALPAPTGLPGAGAPEVTVGAAVSHPF